MPPTAAGDPGRSAIDGGLYVSPIYNGSLEADSAALSPVEAEIEISPIDGVVYVSSILKMTCKDPDSVRESLRWGSGLDDKPVAVGATSA
jgi:hypothetical protein